MYQRVLHAPLSDVSAVEIWSSQKNSYCQFVISRQSTIRHPGYGLASDNSTLPRCLVRKVTANGRGGFG
jgi:hypothetical protein